jgi:hypothetical protein
MFTSVSSLMWSSATGVESAAPPNRENMSAKVFCSYFLKKSFPVKGDVAGGPDELQKRSGERGEERKLPSSPLRPCRL